MHQRRREAVATSVLAAVAALTLAACSGDGGAVLDAGVDAAGDASATGCDPATQDCPTGSKCDFGCQGNTAVVACRAYNGGGAVGDPCSTATPCNKGAGCLTAPDAGSACRKYCAGDGECTTGERCHNVSVAVACGGSSPPLPLRYCY